MLTEKARTSFDEEFLQQARSIWQHSISHDGVSYIPQITNNLAGNKGSFIQPLVAMINCIVWFVYGAFKKERDVPIGDYTWLL